MAVTGGGSRNRAGSYLRDPISHIRLGSGSEAAFFSGPDVARIITIGSESNPFLYICPGSGIAALSRIRLDWTKPDPFGLNEARSVWTERSQIRLD